MHVDLEQSSSTYQTEKVGAICYFIIVLASIHKSFVKDSVIILYHVQIINQRN